MALSTLQLTFARLVKFKLVFNMYKPCPLVRFPDNIYSGQKICNFI
jgi:hypothetical protein